MGFNVNTNLDALNTYRNLQGTQNSLSNSLAKLSSGLRINNAGDDAAGLTIATQLGSQVSGLSQAARNAQDGQSVVQTADGALTQAQSLLGRLRDLAVQAANDSNSDTARAAITKEATSISAELGRLGDSVNFNGKKLLDGSFASAKFQVGADGNTQSQITVDLSGADLKSVSSALATTGVTAKSYGNATITGAQTFVSTVGDKTTSVAVTGLTAGTADTQAGAASVVAQLNGNSAFAASFSASVYQDSSDSKYYVSIAARDGGTVKVLKTSDSSEITKHSDVSNAGVIAFGSATDAQTAINAIDTQIAKISDARANIGALENRFTSATSAIATSISNLTAAKSRITDVDMAAEMVTYSRANILSQSGTAMLAQANSLPQLALKLLG